MVSGVLADDILVYPEVKLLLHWLENHSHILDESPYDRLFPMMNSIEGEMDGVGISKLKAELYKLIGNEVESGTIDDTNQLPLDDDVNEITQMSRFCFVGRFEIASKAKLTLDIENADGIVNEHIRLDTKYLIIGKITQNWKSSHDAELIEQALAYKEMGSGILFINEMLLLKLWKKG